jgi:hypothetical protein
MDVGLWWDMNYLENENALFIRRFELKNKIKCELLGTKFEPFT